MKDFDIAIVFTGHMTDSPDRETPRFPKEMVSLATAAIKKAFLPYALSKKKLVLVSSLARGGDIIAVETALSLKIPVRVILPQPINIFKAASLLGDIAWERRFRRILADVGEKNISVLRGDGQSDTDYVAANERMLSMAEELGNKVVLLAFWDGKQSALPGGTASFAGAVLARGGEVNHIDAKTLLELHLTGKQS